MTARIISLLALVAVVAVQVDSYACATKGGQSHYSQGSFKGQPTRQVYQSSQQVDVQNYQAPLTSYAPAKGHYQPAYQTPVVSSKGSSFGYQQEQRLELPAQPSAQLELPSQTVQQPAAVPTAVSQEQRLESAQSVMAAPAQVETQPAPVSQPLPVVSEQRFEPVPVAAAPKGFFGQTLQRPEVVPQQTVSAPAQVEATPALPLANAPKL